MSATPIRLPNAADFSPNQVDLRRTLEIVEGASGERQAIIEEIRTAFFAHRAELRSNVEDRLEQQTKSGGNPLIALKCYGLVDRASKLTAFGQELLSESDDAQLMQKFARHILLNLHGIEVIYGIWALQTRAEPVGKKSLARQLTSMGVQTFQGKEITGNSTLHTFMLMWLDKAGVVDRSKNHSVNEEVFLRLCGVSRSLLDELRQLSPAQRNFLALLQAHTSEGTQRSFVVKSLMGEMTVDFTEDQFAKEVTRPLADEGWIEWDRTQAEGRGGKSGSVTVLGKLLEVPPAFLRFGETDPVPPKVRRLLDRKLEDIAAGLDSVETKVSGVALEALAVRMAYDLDLTPIDVRSRKEGSKDAEVDVIAELRDVLYARWLFQCKKQNQVGRDVLVRELGLATLMQAQVIVLVTTGKFKSTVLKFADSVTRSTPMQVVLINGETVREYLRASNGPDYLRKAFQDIGRRNGTIKRGQPISEVVD